MLHMINSAMGMMLSSSMPTFEKVYSFVSGYFMLSQKAPPPHFFSWYNNNWVWMVRICSQNVRGNTDWLTLLYLPHQWPPLFCLRPKVHFQIRLEVPFTNRSLPPPPWTISVTSICKCNKFSTSILNFKSCQNAHCINRSCSPSW